MGGICEFMEVVVSKCLLQYFSLQGRITEENELVGVVRSIMINITEDRLEDKVIV